MWIYGGNTIKKYCLLTMWKNKGVNIFFIFFKNSLGVVPPGNVISQFNHCKKMSRSVYTQISPSINCSSSTHL